MVASSPPLSKSSTAPGAGQTEAYLCDRTHPTAQAANTHSANAHSAEAKLTQDTETLEVKQPKEALPTAETSAAPSAPQSHPTEPSQSKFPPRLSREPRPTNSPYANINLPLFVTQTPRNAGPTTSPRTPVSAQKHAPKPTTIESDVVTLDMRPARPHVSSLWHRLRFSRFSPMASQRRSSWKPGKPRRGRPDGTKGAGSRSL